MSSAGSHMIIGGAATLVLGRSGVLDGLLGQSIATDPLRLGIVVLAGALAATWPDIDEPNSFIARRVRLGCTLLGCVLGGVLGAPLFAPFPAFSGIGASVAGALFGFIGGAGIGALTPRLVRALAGGHRAATHSVLLGLVLIVLAVVVPGVIGQVAGVFAWGLFAHLLGDVVTPGGVALFSPLSERRLHILPRVVTGVGEALAVSGALVSVLWMVTRS